MSLADQIKVAKLSPRALSAEIDWLDIRIDRASVLGNPFEIPRNCPVNLLAATRDYVVFSFRQWLWENIKLFSVNPNGRVSLDPFIAKGLSIAKKFKNPTAKQVVGELKRIYQLLVNRKKIRLAFPFRGKKVKLLFLSKGKRIRLLCWCHPLLCHGDVIKSFLVEAGQNSKLRYMILD